MGAISTAGGYISSTEQIASGVLANGGTYTTLTHTPSAVGAGTWARETNSVFWGDFCLSNVSGAANGNNCSFTTCLPAGTYKLQLFYGADAYGGILDTYIDGTEVASMDLYLASPGNFWAMKEETGIVVATGGPKTIKLQLDGKHASSAGYWARLYAFSFIRTA